MNGHDFFSALHVESLFFQKLWAYVPKTGWLGLGVVGTEGGARHVPKCSPTEPCPKPIFIFILF